MIAYKNYSELHKEEINLICDYLKVPSKSIEEDEQRREELYKIGFIHVKIQTNEKKTGPLGEGIVRLYYEKLNIPYIHNPSWVKYVDNFDKQKKMRPDGLIGSKEKNWVEVKMRAYRSQGTAHEKIPSVPWKYRFLGSNLTLFLLADDEHKYNRDWSKILRGEIKNISDIEKLFIKANHTILKEVIYGTEVANTLEK